MKILIALDTKSYSQKILKDVARLAENTLADLVFLGVQDKKNSHPQEELTSALRKYQQDVYSHFSPEELPYAEFNDSKLQPISKGTWSVSAQGMKGFTLRIASGGIAKQIVATASELECDLIILGCSGKPGCEWDGEMNVPLRVTKDASCSVLVIKQARAAKQIVSILDQSFVSQDSLEMVNQLVTIHDAGLKIIGIKEKKTTKEDALERRMIELLKYYNEREINVWVKLLESAYVKEYVTNSSKEAIVALWMGKQSLINKLFFQGMVDKLLETTKSSLLILR